MLKLSDGNCGLCAHFGDSADAGQHLVQIRIAGEAPEDLIEPCGLPTNASIGLRVSAVSGCSGFTPAKAG